MATNFNDTTPAASSGKQNAAWQKDGSGNVSAQVPSDGGVVSKTADYTLTVAEDGALVVFNGTNKTATLPAIVPSAKWRCWIINLNSSALTVARNSLNIDGAAANLSLAQYQGIYVTTDGTNYFTSRGLVTDATLSTSDITTNNVSTSKHGFVPKLPNDATKYLDGTGAFTVPSGTGGGSSTLAGLTDVNLTSPADGDVLTYDSGSTKWVNEAPSGGGGSGDSGKNIVMLPHFNSTDTGDSNFSFFIRIRAEQIQAIGSSCKLVFMPGSASVPIAAAVIRSTAPGDTAFVATGQFLWSGSGTPTFSSGTRNTSDALSFTIDTNHDYYVIVAVGSNSSAFPSVNPSQWTNVWGESSFGEASGDKTATSDTTGLSFTGNVLVGIAQLLIA